MIKSKCNIFLIKQIIISQISFFLEYIIIVATPFIEVNFKIAISI